MGNLYTFWLSGERIETVGTKMTVEAESSEEARKKLEDIIESDRYDRKIPWEHICTDLTIKRKVQSGPLEVHRVFK